MSTSIRSLRESRFSKIAFVVAKSFLPQRSRRNATFAYLCECLSVLWVKNICLGRSSFSSVFPAGPQSKHLNEATRHLAQGIHFLFAICDRRGAHTPAKQRAERAQTLKANFKTHVGHAQFFPAQQLFGLFDATLNQVLVRRGLESITEQPQKVIARKTCLF